MRLLLDTHTLIWWWSDHPRLPPHRATIVAPENRVYVSAVSAWEMANKVRSGRLPEMQEAIDNFDLGVVGDGFAHLDVRHDHAVRAGLLPGAHRDPFDRLLAAQALIENLVVVTRDPALATFGCQTLW